MVGALGKKSGVGGTLPIPVLCTNVVGRTGLVTIVPCSPSSDDENDVVESVKITDIHNKECYSAENETIK